MRLAARRGPIEAVTARVRGERREPALAGPVVLLSRAVLLDADTWVEGGLWIERGRVQRVLASRASAHRARARVRRSLDLGEAVLAPGLIDAHAHLELGALAGRLPAGRDFARWIRSLVALRAGLERAAFESGVRTGLAQLLLTGTTAVGDVDSTGASTRLARRLGLRGVVYRELLDAFDPARTRAALAKTRRSVPLGHARFGLAPHAPYTTSDELLAGAARRARRSGLALSIHWAETTAESDWLADGSGPLARLLPASPLRAGLARLDAAGLLTPRTSLVHGNDPRRGEPELLARRGVTLVHCPGAHLFFARPPFPLGRYRSAGVALALGTDSLAGNAETDLRREMALFRRAFPRVSPGEVFTMATAGGARALGRADLGHARAGASAELVAWRLDARNRRSALEELTAARPPVAQVFLSGRPVLRSPSAG